MLNFAWKSQMWIISFLCLGSALLSHAQSVSHADEKKGPKVTDVVSIYISIFY